MCPIDPSPHGGEILHELPERPFPEPRLDGADVASGRGIGEASAGSDGPSIAQRPPVPEHPQQMAVDVEDEEADPVVDSGPGIADGPEPSRRWRGPSV